MWVVLQPPVICGANSKQFGFSAETVLMKKESRVNVYQNWHVEIVSILYGVGGVWWLSALPPAVLRKAKALPPAVLRKAKPLNVSPVLWCGLSPLCRCAAHVKNEEAAPNQKLSSRI